MINTILYILLLIIIWECISSGTILYLRTKQSQYLFLPVTGVLLIGMAIAVRLSTSNPFLATELSTITGAGILITFICFVIYVIRNMKKNKNAGLNGHPENTLEEREYVEEQESDEEAPEESASQNPHTIYITLRIDYECEDNTVDLEEVTEAAIDCVIENASKATEEEFKSLRITDVTNCGESI